MNRTLLLAIALGLATTTTAQIVGDGPDPLQLKGNVKEVKALYNKQSNAYWHLQVSQDKKEMTMTSYLKDGQAEVNRAMKLNEDGDIIQEEKYIASIDQRTKTTYEFEQGKKAVEKTTYKGKERVSATYQYYDNDKLHQTTKYKMDGTIDYIQTYTYGKVGAYQNENRKNSTYFKNYNNKDRMTITMSDGKGKWIRTTEYIYDEQHNPILVNLRTSLGNPNGTKLTYTYLYDPIGNYISYDAYKDGALIATHEREITYL